MVEGQGFYEGERERARLLVMRCCALRYRGALLLPVRREERSRDGDSAFRYVVFRVFRFVDERGSEKERF